MTTNASPNFERIRAVDVQPYRWGQWSSVGGSTPFLNQIVSKRWSENGDRIWFMLDSHNFMSAEPDEVLELVPMKPHDGFVDRESVDGFIAKRPGRFNQITEHLREAYVLIGAALDLIDTSEAAEPTRDGLRRAAGAVIEAIKHVRSKEAE